PSTFWQTHTGSVAITIQWASSDNDLTCTSTGRATSNKWAPQPQEELQANKLPSRTRCQASTRYEQYPSWSSRPVTPAQPSSLSRPAVRHQTLASQPAEYLSVRTRSSTHNEPKANH